MLVDASTFASTEFDYIVVGGGTAGLVVAARLSEDPDVTVGVIEAGQHVTDSPAINVPGLAGSAIFNDKYDWCFKTVPQAGCNGRQIIQPRGKVLGGSSAINLLIMGRANREEYDALEQLGNKGWNWPEFLKYFRKSETLSYPDAEYVKEYGLGLQPECHGDAGPLQNSYNRYVWKQLHNSYVATLDAMGIANNPEPAGGRNVGSTFSTVCIDPSKVIRSYAGNAYYEPNAGRKNLLLLTGAQASKVVLDSSKGIVEATGVEFICGGSTYAAKVRREVILSSGSYQSPQLLELSGIGRPDILSKFGIKTVIDLPVGENLRELKCFECMDHSYVTSVFESHPDSHTSDDLRIPEVLAQQMQLYETKKEGPFSSTVSAYGFIPLPSFATPDQLQNLKSKIDADVSYNASEAERRRFGLLQRWLDDPEHAQIETIHRPQMRVGAGTPSPGKKYQTIMTCSMHPISRGSVHIQSADPLAPPAIDPNYLGNPVDLDLMVSALKFVRRITETQPLASSIVGKVVPGEDVQTDEQFAEYIKNQVLPVYHPVGTVSMLPRDDGGVVDGRLVVYGTKNLRVVDASIIPLQLSCHIQATVYAIAEKGADLIKGL